MQRLLPLPSPLWNRHLSRGLCSGSGLERLGRSWGMLPSLLPEALASPPSPGGRAGAPAVGPGAAPQPPPVHGVCGQDQPGARQAPLLPPQSTPFPQLPTPTGHATLTWVAASARKGGASPWGPGPSLHPSPSGPLRRCTALLALGPAWAPGPAPAPTSPRPWARFWFRASCFARRGSGAGSRAMGEDSCPFSWHRSPGPDSCIPRGFFCQRYSSQVLSTPWVPPACPALPWTYQERRPIEQRHLLGQRQLEEATFSSLHFGARIFDLGIENAAPLLTTCRERGGERGGQGSHTGPGPDPDAPGNRTRQSVSVKAASTSSSRRGPAPARSLTVTSSASCCQSSSTSVGRGQSAGGQRQAQGLSANPWTRRSWFRSGHSTRLHCGLDPQPGAARGSHR